MTEYRAKYVEDYLADMERTLKEGRPELAKKVPEIVEAVCKARDAGKRVYVMGNGGSAATASHFVNDLNKLTAHPRYKRIKMIALTDNVPTMLAWANDASYDVIFEEQLKSYMEPGDVVIGISGSGNSTNVVRALEYANAQGGHTVAIVGYGGGKMAKIAKTVAVVPSHNMQRCEDVHHMMMHLVCSILRDEQDGKKAYPVDLRKPTKRTTTAI